VITALFLGPVCALVQELRGVPCLHASAVQIGPAAVAFLGHTGTGKSSLAAALVHHGYALVSDDVLPLVGHGGRCLVVPGYPQMKLHPRLVQTWGLTEKTPVSRVNGWDKLQVPVGRGWGRFAARRVPLAAVYELERAIEGADQVRICPLQPGESLVGLLRFSFCARLVEVLGLGPRRMAQLAELARCFPVRRLRYPSGWDHLGEVRQALLRDLDAMS
jgi:hypothetical protein